MTAPGVLGNDADPDAGTTLSAVLVSGPAHGMLTLNADGSFTYQPDANYSGPDSFVYRASDGTLQSGDTSVTLDVTAVADPPTAGTDGYTIAEDTLLTVTAPGVLGNDADPDAATTLSAVLVSGPAHGMLTLNADGSFTYQPDANYSGPDSFVYRASDGTLQSGDTSVTLDVTAVADPPTAGADGYTIAEDTLLTVTAPGVLGNDADPDAGTTLSAVLMSGPAHGTLTLNAGRQLHLPAGRQLQRRRTASSTAPATAPLQSGDTSVTLDVTAVADPPTAGTDGYTIAEDTPADGAGARRARQRRRPGRRHDPERGARERPGPRRADAQRRRQLHLPAGRQLQRAGQLRLPRQRRHAAERRHQRHPRRHRGRGSADGRHRRLHDRRRHAC